MVAESISGDFDVFFRNNAENPITLEELQDFMRQVDNLACRIEEADLIVVRGTVFF